MLVPITDVPGGQLLQVLRLVSGTLYASQTIMLLCFTSFEGLLTALQIASGHKT
jgi:hypothetical protein